MGRAAAGVGDGLFNFSHDFGVNGVELGLAQLARFCHSCPKVFERAVVFTEIFQLPLGSVSLRVADKMAMVTPLFGEYACWAVARTRMRDGLACRLVDGKEISAIGYENREAKGFGTSLQVITAHRVVDRCVLGVIVILDDENRWSLEHNGHIHRFKTGALVHRAITRK